MAHKKGGGSSNNGRDSKPKMLGVKRYGGQVVTVQVKQIEDEVLEVGGGDRGG